MADNSDKPFWMKALTWAQSITQAIGKRSAIKRDAHLKMYDTEFSWIDTTRLVKLQYEVVAETEAQARQLANAQAVIEVPMIESMLENRKIIPPYIKDASAALPLWKIKEIALTDGQREFAKEGKLGPARTFELRQVMVAAPQP